MILSTISSKYFCLMIPSRRVTSRLILPVMIYLAFDDTWLRKGETRNHVIGQRIGILWVDSVIRGDEDDVEHPLLVKLQLVVGDNDGGMGLEGAVGEEEINLHDIFLVVFHR